MTMNGLVEAASTLLRRVPAGEEWVETGLEGLRIRRIAHRRAFDCVFHGPLCGLVLQGSKEVATGGRKLVLKPGDAMVVSHHIPAVSRVTEGSPERPYIGAVVPFNMTLLAELWRDIRKAVAPGDTARAIEATRAPQEIVGAFARLLALDTADVQTPILAPMVVKEIHLRFLVAPQGAILRAMVARDSQASRIGRAIAHIRRSDRPACSVADMAGVAGMGASSFHAHFKAMTGMTPLGYQKELRLMRARDLLGDPEQSVSSVAFAVGYESPTQFSREYSRRFGASPGRHRSSEI